MFSIILHDSNSIFRARELIQNGFRAARYEPKEFMTWEIAAIPTISGSSLEDIDHLYDVQREFGEQDQQAPVM